MHDKNAGLAVVLALLLLCAALVPGCTAGRGPGVPRPEAPVISPPDLPEPPVTTVAVPGSEDRPCPSPSVCIREPG